jgi:Undecaprenyl-phosphate glucose phosphotransferase
MSMSNAQHDSLTEPAAALPGKTIRANSKPLGLHSTILPYDIASRSAYSPVVLTGVVSAIEIALVLLIGLLCYRGVNSSDDFARYGLYSLAISLLTLVTFKCADIHHLQAFRNPDKYYLRVTLAWSIVLLIVIALSRFSNIEHGISAAWLISYYLTGLVILIVFRRTLCLLTCRWTQQGRFDRRTVLVGGGDRTKALLAQLTAEADSDLRIIGVFDDRGEDRSPLDYGGIPKLGKIDDLVEFSRQIRVDLALVVLPITAEERILQMLKTLWVLPLDIRLVAHGNKLQFRPRSYSYIGNVPVFDLFDKPIANWGVVAKWLFDKIIGGVVLICAAPMMAVIALAVKLESKGPIFFKQQRHGFNNNVFEIYKFRSMYVEHADPMAHNVVTRNDPRITRVGRFLRRTSLDELPQLLNVVFIGNMSLVGPRPHAVYGTAEGLLYGEAIDGYFARHRVKPGITGWAQIHGFRGGTDSNEKIRLRVEYDLYYIESWSIPFDFWILIRTPFALLHGENAY